MIAKCLNDKPLEVYGEGKNCNWLYVDDHSKANNLPAQRQNREV